MRLPAGLCLLALVVAACATAPASSDAPPSAPASASPSATAAETPSAAPTSTAPDASPSPAAAALVIPDIAVGDYLEVTGNGLAVRAGPGTEHALVAEWMRTGMGDGLEVTAVRDEVRLPAGYVVRAELGPLVVDDTAWYAVTDVPQAGENAGDDTMQVWRSADWVPSDEYEFELTWIAVSQPGTTLVRLTDLPACSQCGYPPRPVVVASGVGEGRVGPWTNERPPFITFAGAAPSSTDTCEFRIVSQAGDTFLDEPGVEFIGGQTGARLAPDGESEAEVWLDIIGDCAWAVSVQLTQG